MGVKCGCTDQDQVLILRAGSEVGEARPAKVNYLIGKDIKSHDLNKSFPNFHGAERKKKVFIFTPSLGV